MTRRVMMVLIVVAVTLGFGFAAPAPSAHAEAGCGVSAFKGSATQAGGSFNCAIGDTGARQLQVCYQRPSGATGGCILYNYSGYSGSHYSSGALCTGGSSIRAWVWFYGEDGSTTTKVSGYWSC